MEKKFTKENVSKNKKLWVVNKKLNSKNLLTNPANGGIPDILKKHKTTVNDVKLTLKKTFKFTNVLIFLTSYKNNKLKNKYSNRI